jgi:hypothetical protein
MMSESEEDRAHEAQYICVLEFASSRSLKPHGWVRIRGTGVRISA